MSNRFSNWDEQQKRMEAHRSAQQKSQRISSATAGKKKKRKPENKGKHRKDVNVIKSKETNVKVKTQKDKEGDVNVGITFNRRGNRKGQGRPAGVVGASGRAGSSLASAFGQQQTAQQTAQQRGGQTTEAERRQTRQDRLDRQRIEDRERARDRAERTQQREQERRRENARLIIERERLALERNRPAPVAPAPANAPDDIGRGFDEMRARIGALDAQVRAGQNIAPPQINVNVPQQPPPNINVVGVEAGGIVINNRNEGARAVANNRGRRANIDRRGGGAHQSFSEESSGDSDIGRPADRRRAERNQRTQPRRPQQRPPAPAPPPAPSETEVGDVSEAESFAVVERGSGTESDEPTIAEIGGEALLGLGGGLARGVGAGATTIGEAVVSGLPSAEDVGGAIGGGIATGAGIAGRAGLAGASAIGGAVVNVVRDAIAPTPAPEPAPEPEPLGLIAQRIAKQKEELRAPTITPGVQPSPLTFNKPAEQATILADIASQAVSGAVAGGRKAINLVSDGLKAVEETVRPHFDYDPLKEGISGRTKRLEEKSEYDLGELSSEGEGAGKIFSGSSGGESDTSYQRIIEGGSAFGSGSSGDELKTGGTPKPPKALTAKQRREALAVGGADELFNQFDDIVKTGGDVLEEAVEKPDSPKPLVSEEILRAKAFGVPKKAPKPKDSGDEGKAVDDVMYGDIIRQHATFAPADPTAGGTPKPKRRASSVRPARPAIRTTSTTKSIDLKPTESSSEEADFFRQSGDLDVSGFGSATESSSSEDVDVSELRKRERAKIRREQIRRGVSKEEAEVLARMGSRFLGDSSSSEGEGRPPEFNERLKSNATEVGNIERALAELDAQKKRNKGMGAIPKSQYDAEELKLINLLRRFRQQQTDLSTATNLPASINLSEADRTSLDNLIRGDDLITTKGGARSGAGRPQTKLFESQTQQQKFEVNQNDTAENLRRLNARLKTIKDLPRTQRNRLIGQISTKDRNAILASLTGRLQQASIDSVMATYDAIIENKRLERLYRKDARD